MSRATPPAFSGPAPQLRELTLDDLPLMQAVFASTRAEEMALTGWPPELKQGFLQMQFEAQAADYERRFPASRCQVIEWQGQAVGRLWIARVEQRLHLLDISLLPEAREQGLGTRLLQDLQQQARALGLPLSLQVLLGNPARRLYARLGFVPDGAPTAYQAMIWRAGSAGQVEGPDAMVGLTSGLTTGTTTSATTLGPANPVFTGSTAVPPTP